MTAVKKPLAARNADRASATVPSLSRRALLTAGLGAAGFAGTGTTLYAAHEAAERLAVTSYKLSPPGWPPGNRLSIAVIADIHAAGPNMGRKRLREVVETANGLDCELILLLGDYVGHHVFVTEQVPNLVWAAELARLRAPLGVYAIYGNHDWWHGIEGIRAAFASVGIPVLENDVVHLGVPGRRFWLAGLGCTIAHRLGHGRFRGIDDLPGTLAKIATDDPALLMVHEPDVFIHVPARISLTIAGHTHGGQIRVPGLWGHWVPSAYGTRFAYGHIVEDDRHLVVSGGLGVSAVPLRLGVPPEIVRIDLG
jgi:predicted MPP superfamily phosphohydrolase